MSEDKNFLKKFPRLQATSDTGKLIEFKLQLSLGITAVKVNNIYNISNTHVNSSFDSYSKGSTLLQSFLSTEQLTDQNKLEKICQKGFDLPEEGMTFNVGYKKINMKNRTNFSVIFCKLSVGKSYCYDAEKWRQKKIDLPESFDSIYLYKEEDNPPVYHHDYVMFKNYQVYPEYLIDFTIDSYKQKQSQHPYCDNCTKQPPNFAKVYCQTEEANFCEQCDNEFHTSSKVASKHYKVEIYEKNKKFGNCPKHENSKLQLYCLPCSEALCISCTISGDHASGEYKNHKILHLKEAYNNISSTVKEIDPNIVRRQNQLREDLSKIDLKIKEVNNNATHVEEQITSMFRKALDELKQETQKKLSFLIGDQLELKRQFDHIEWMESFLKYSLQVQEPNDFLGTWNKYTKYKKDLLSLTNLSINTEVKADMKVQGSINVILQSKKRKGLDPNAFTNSLQREPFTEIMSPFKQSYQPEKELGSTQLRRSVFQKHYTEKKKNTGMEPSFSKGSYGGGGGKNEHND